MYGYHKSNKKEETISFEFTYLQSAQIGCNNGKEWFINNKTHVHNIIWYKVTYLFIFFIYFLHLCGYKSKKKHIFSFHFLSHCNPNRGKRNTLFSFLFSYPYFQTYTRQLISFLFFLIFLLLFVSFVLSCLPSFLFSILKKNYIPNTS